MSCSCFQSEAKIGSPSTYVTIRYGEGIVGVAFVGVPFVGVAYKVYTMTGRSYDFLCMLKSNK